jgi:hypothetical protein
MRNLLLQLIAGGLIFLTPRLQGAEPLSRGNRDSNGQPVAQSATATDLIASFRSKGHETRGMAKSLGALSEIAAMPATHEVVTGLIAKITARIARSSAATNLVASIGTSRVQTLFQAAIQFDAAGELRRSPTGELSALILLRTSDQQHEQLRKEFTSQTKEQPTDHLRVNRSGKWTVISLGNGVTDPSKLEREAEDSEQSAHWIDLTADLNKLGIVLPDSNISISNKLHLVVSPQGDGLRSEIHLNGDRPYGLQLGNWNVPTNTIRDPLIGFTAVQGIAEWLQKQPTFRTIGLSNAPNQAFFWAQPISAFSVSAAVPSESPRAAIDSIVKNYLPTLNSTLAPLGVGTFEVFTNQNILTWRGLPIAIPFVRPAPTADSKFLFGGLFPLVDLGTNVPPPELMAQVTARTNLVYYDWEITSERLSQWRQISQLIAIVQNKFSGDTNLLSERWLRGIEPKLGNCITEITLTQPRELSLVRRSAIGFNSLELAILARWLDPAYEKPAVKRTRTRKSPVRPLPSR